MHFAINHKTEYTYFEPVSLCHNLVKLVPRDTEGQSCHNVVLRIHPRPDIINEYLDFFGNRVIYFSIEKEHSQLVVEVTSEIEKKSSPPDLKAFGKSTVGQLRREIQDLKPGYAEIRQYVFESAMTAWDREIEEYALESFAPDRPFLDASLELMRRIYSDFEFRPGFTSISTPLEELMQHRKGVCQDFAHLAIACVRSVGLPARYVSGYIETLSPEGTEKLVGADASHAWFSVYTPESEWVDFDPTNNVLAADQHITIGWGRDYSDIAPFRGVLLSSGSHEMAVSVDVKRAG